MNIIGRSKLEALKMRHKEVCSQVDAWVAEAEIATWKTTHDIKRRYASASFLANRHVIFNLKGPKYRVATQISFDNQIVLIKEAGTHEEYMKWGIT